MSESDRLRFWQWSTVTILTVGYAGYYLCRSTLSVCLPLIAHELELAGMDSATAKIRLGGIASAGVLAYAIGKFASGVLADVAGGRTNFLLGMAGAVLFTALFAISGAMPLFFLTWCGNRLLQSCGWVGMVKLASRWFAYSTYGSVMGIISLSYLFGDAAARRFMGALLANGLDWRTVFFVAAGVLGAMMVVAVAFLHETPRDLGLIEPEAAADNVYGDTAADGGRVGVAALLLPLLREPTFRSVCVLSLGVTLVRETFNTWTPTYFTEVVGLSSADAASWSALFPLFGGASVLIAGYGSDWLGRLGRAWIILIGVSSSALTLVALSNASSGYAVWLVGAVALTMLGPYSYLAGAIALDFGGKRGSATACGVIDGIGYLGGVLAGDAIARVATSYGWPGAFRFLAAVAAIAALAAWRFLSGQRAMLARGGPARAVS